jgi:hypothetical protein
MSPKSIHATTPSNSDSKKYRFPVGAVLIAGAVLLTLLILLMWGVLWLQAGRLDFWAGKLTASVYYDSARSVVTLVGALAVGVTIWAAVRAQISTQEKFESEQEDRVLDRDRLRAQDRRARFSAAAEQMSSVNAAARVGAVYTLATLADEFGEERDRASQQTCVDMLCAYVRMSSPPKEVQPSSEPEIRFDREGTEMTRAIFSVIREHCNGHLVEHASWSSRRFDFRGAHIREADLTGLQLSQGVLDFSGATVWGELNLTKGMWSSGEVTMIGTSFNPGSVLNLADTVIDGANVRLLESSFAGSNIRALRLKVKKGALRLDLKEVSKSNVSFERSHFLGGTVVLQLRLKEFSHLRLADVTVSSRLHLRLNLREGTSARLARPVLLESGIIRIERTVLQPSAQLLIEQPTGPITSAIDIDAPQYNGGSLRLKKLPIDDGPSISLGGKSAPSSDVLLHTKS